MRTEFEKISPFGEYGLASFTQNGKMGFINKSGEIVIPAKFQRVESLEDAAEWGDVTHGYINSSGEIIVPPKFLTVGRFNEYGLAGIGELGSGFGYVNTLGEMIVPTKYEEAEHFNEYGLASIKQNDKWGCINTSGEIIIAPQFKGIGLFDKNGVAKATFGNR